MAPVSPRCLAILFFESRKNEIRDLNEVKFEGVLWDPGLKLRRDAGKGGELALDEAS